MPRDDAKLIAAYLDDRMSASAFRAFEGRLKSEPELVKALARSASDEALIAQAVETHAAISGTQTVGSAGDVNRVSRMERGRGRGHVFWFAIGVAAACVIGAVFIVSQRTGDFAEVVSVSGDATLLSGGRQFQAAAADLLLPGARISTANSGEIVVRIEDGSVLEIEQDTVVKLQREANGAFVRLPSIGRVGITAAKQSAGRQFYVQLQYAEIAVQGTEFRVEQQARRGRVRVLDGVLDCVHQSGESSRVEAGQTVVITARGLQLLKPEAGSEGRFAGLNAYHLIAPNSGLGELHEVVPVAVERLPDIRMPGAFSEVVGGVLLDGYINVPETGQYDFFLQADDAARVEIAGNVVSQARMRQRGEKRGSVFLESGLNPFRIVAYNHLQLGSVSLKWAPAGGTPQEISPNALWSDHPTHNPGHRVIVVSSLGTYKDNYSMNLVDADPDTFFWSDGSPVAGSHVTVYFPEALQLREVEVLTGLPDGDRDFLQSGKLEVSLDGTSFRPLCEFENGRAHASLAHLPSIRAIRIVATKAQYEWLAIHSFIVR